MGEVLGHSVTWTKRTQGTLNRNNLIPRLTNDQVIEFSRQKLGYYVKPSGSIFLSNTLSPPLSHSFSLTCLSLSQFSSLSRLLFLSITLSVFLYHHSTYLSTFIPHSIFTFFFLSHSIFLSTSLFSLNLYL